ncbi:branched-chain amino acid transporter permease [Pseudoramibacter sp.]|jgi:branched-subunit amino acid transport protein AzlD|uniref:branched-chain amino acid transporter permease n=1 Tax=Pseudoramibacter sp. TaxID=2034862 RepID=UPI0025E87027|nr:AzlD domain-containing protein [Pseudoramibacter sp.]MCH4071601.1 AzlD domain-containing protein [Pseudoramibacter sp.]MCH4105369.1 AzlD domain-containing protein [Pseudoramibacter sp.]
MTPLQQVITVAVVVAGTVLTRFLPYVLFPEGRAVPPFMTYLGKVLAPAVFGLLVVYCLRHVSVLRGTHGIPELISIGVVVALYAWKRGMILPMLGGTLCYMLLVQFIF